MSASEPRWLLDDGLEQLEQLFRVIVYPSHEPILITDDDRNCRDASCGTGKLLGLSRDRIIGRKIDDLVEPNFRAQIDPLWQSFIRTGERPGFFRFVGADGTVREVECTAKRDVLPGRHALTLRDKSARDKATKPSGALAAERPETVQEKWVRDYAVYLFDVGGRVVSWFGGAERLYG